MDALQGEGVGMREFHYPGFHPNDEVDAGSVNTRFDASQYDFFGRDGVEEFELGGLEGDGDESVGFLRMYNDDARFSPLGMDEGDIDDLASVFSKLNKNVSGPRNAGVIGDRRSLSRESSSTADWSHEADFSDSLVQAGFDPDNSSDAKRWWSQPQPPSSPVASPKPLYRTATYPQQQPLLAGPTSPSPAAALPLLRHSSVPLSLQPQPLQPSFSSGGSQLRHVAAPYHSVYGRHPSLIHPHHQQAVAELLRRQFLLAPPQPPNFLSHSFIPPAAPAMRGGGGGSGGSRGARQSSGSGSGSGSGNGGQKFRSKYMTSEEIEGILRNLQSAGHASGDAYVDDYYHQACIAKRAASATLPKKLNFRPAALNDGPTHRSRSGHHDSAHRSFVQTDSLGRVSFTSLRRPRALLQPAADSLPTRPLELEPLVAARVTVEDGFYLLLEVEDIDRVMQDGGSAIAQLRRRRQVLLEGLAASLQLVDPLGRASGLGPNDDMVFLRLTALPKGRKLIAKYLRLVNGDLARKVCMAVFRHLRFLYGAPLAEAALPSPTAALTQAVVACVCGMDLSALSSCLVAVVCSSEQPPLRPIGGAAGDGASVMVMAVLDRATQLLSGPHGAAGFSLEVRSLWQASFNAFFGLLSKYCLRKYDAIVQSLHRRDSGGAASETAAEVTKAVGREMPVELLRASLPHTDEQQQLLLMDFARRSTTVAVTGFSAGDGGGGGELLNSEFVPG